jgi:hypothetical protein
MLFGKDVNTAKFMDGKKVSFNGNIANPAALKKAYNKDGATLQVLQGSMYPVGGIFAECVQKQRQGLLLWPGVPLRQPSSPRNTPPCSAHFPHDTHARWSVRRFTSRSALMKRYGGSWPLWRISWGVWWGATCTSRQRAPKVGVRVHERVHGWGGGVVNSEGLLPREGVHSYGVTGWGGIGRDVCVCWGRGCKACVYVQQQCTFRKPRVAGEATGMEMGFPRPMLLSCDIHL